MRLTAKALDNLTANGGRRDLSVRGLPGLLVRVSATRGGTSRSWRYRYFRDGRPRVLTLGDYPAVSVATARVLHAELAEIVRAGGDPQAHVEKRRADRLPAHVRPTAGPTVADIAEEFLRVIARTRKRPEAARYLIEANVLPEIGSRAVADLRKRDFVVLLENIVARGSPVVANRVHALLKQMFATVADRDLIETVPPMPRARPGGEEKPRDRVLTDAEIARLWRGLDTLAPSGRRGDTVNRPLALALKLLLVTAQRRGELAAARWSDITAITNTDASGHRRRLRTWRIPETKTDRPHDVPLSPLAVRLLAALRRTVGRSPYLLPSATDTDASANDRDRTITRAARRVHKRLGMNAWTPHDLRRTARTGMARIGVAEAVAERVLNHAESDRMVAVYNRHSYDVEIRAALDAWAAEIERIVA